MTDTTQWQAFVKAQDQANGPPRPTLAWARARRANFKIFDDRVEIGDWTLRHSDVTHAHLYQTAWGIKNRVLEIATPDKTVQVNFNPGVSPEAHLPYPLIAKPFPRWLALFRVGIWLFCAGLILFTLIDAFV